MKKHLTLNTFLVLVLFCSRLGAQLSGVVTINSVNPPSLTNFTSFATFAATLNAQGVSGPLTVNVSPGTYNEQVEFKQAPGISSTNTITINGNNAVLTFAASSTTMRHTLLLSGADFMTFNNLIVSGTTLANALSCHLWAGADNNTFNNCTFNASNAATAAAATPFSISGTSVSATATGLGGNNNVVNTCTINGGYYSVSFYGSTAAPFNVNNQVINSQLLDFYATGFYNGYCQNSVVRGCLLERLTRTNATATEGIYLNTGTFKAMIENNTIRRVFNGLAASTTVAFYGVYSVADPVLGNENVIRNNIISDITKTNGIIYGLYINASTQLRIYHNTISLDDATATAGNTRGIYLNGASSNCDVRNNLVTVTRGGTGVKYCLYYSATALNLISDNNALFMNAPAGANNIAWMTNDYANLGSWQAATGLDGNSVSADPVYLNLSGMNYEPTSLQVNNQGTFLGVTTDIFGTTRSQLFPDPGAIEIYTANCSGPPAANSFTTPSVLFCPGKNIELKLQSSGNYSYTGISISWQTSTTSAVGPFTTVPTATLNSYSTPILTQTRWYRAVVSCLTGGSYTTATEVINVAPPTTSVVPYFESFEALAYNQLPNCSWSASNMGGSTLTYTNIGTNNRVPYTGKNYASFASTPIGTNYFYTNGIHLVAGITYSASLKFITDLGFTNWPDLSILVGPNQTPAGLQTIVSTGGTLTPVLYTTLSNTFTVNSTGMYYVAVSATSGNGVAPYLSWDDLYINIPCELNGTNLLLSSSAATICAGQTATLTGAGAGAYSWSTGHTTNSIVVSPSNPTTYVLAGLNTLSNCSDTLTQFIDVNPSPQVIAVADNTASCAGQTVGITAYGAASYFWENGQTSSSIVVAPNTTTSYSVVGMNSFGCSDVAVVQVVVSPSPNISASGTQTNLCNGDQVSLSANGGASYQWYTSSSSMQLGNPVSVSPNSSVIYTVVGTDAKGCQGKAYISLVVSECTGLNELTLSNAGRIYPNPAATMLVVETGDAALNLELVDVTGRKILSREVNSSKETIDISGLSNGIYYIRIAKKDSIETFKVVKSDN